MRDRRYEVNFDPRTAETGDVKVATSGFEGQSSLPRIGEATQGLLTRLRDIGGLKPWGAIVYDKEAGKWGMAWSDPTRKDAVTSAREHCGKAKCPIELSFFGTSCGAFALSTQSFSIVSRDDVQKAKQEALDECGKRGQVSTSVGPSCAARNGRDGN